MLFRKKMERACVYCQKGAQLEEDLILCTKKGLRNPDDKCWRFQYDPCKRIPLKAKALDLSAYRDADYSL